MFLTLLDQLAIDSYVSFNGSYVVFEGDVISKKPLSTEKLKELEELALEKGHPMVFLDHLTGRSNKENHPHIQDSIGTLKLPYPPKDPTFYHERDIYQALLFCQQHEESHYELHQEHFDFVRWHDVSTDVLPLGGSKARGIEELLKLVQIPKENSFAFGDGLNDVEMLQYVGTGIAMGNAVNEAKEAADIVTADVDNDGILLGLKKVGLL